MITKGIKNPKIYYVIYVNDPNDKTSPDITKLEQMLCGALSISNILNFYSIVCVAILHFFVSYFIMNRLPKLPANNAAK